MIVVEHLTKKYGSLTAVRDLSFRVEKGKIWGLLGPNAAGKTTTMRVLTGYLSATGGKASVGPYDVFEEPNEVKKIIGYLPETVPLYADMTVAGYLEFITEIKQVPAAKKREAVERAVEEAGLQSVRGRLIKNISRGYKQRVGIAQALIHDPQVLILDEPTIGLAPAQIIEIRQLVKSLKKNHTIMLSTHILQEVTQTCDGAVIINEGQLMASGSLDELTASFKDTDGVVLKLRKGNAEVAALLKKVPGVETVKRDGNEYRVEWVKGRQDLRDDITRLVVDKDLGLLEMRPAALNIEDLYLKIVSGGSVQ